jgi:hypothetical protein
MDGIPGPEFPSKATHEDATLDGPEFQIGTDATLDVAAMVPIRLPSAGAKIR